MTTAGTPGANAEPRSFKRWLMHEITRFIWIFLYLWVLFGLFVLHERIILGQRGIDFALQGFALVNALILAKVMLIAEDLKLDQRFSRYPLLVSIAIDAALFATLFLVFHVLEAVVVGLVQGRPAVASVPAIGQGGLAGAITTAVILFFALLPYFMFKNLSRILGPERFKGLLTGSPTTLRAQLEGDAAR